MKILVTGGAGFIGGHLCQRLIQLQNDIVIVDNLHSYYSADQKNRQLDMIRQAGDFTFYQMDLLEEDSVRKLFENEKYDIVIHLAALPGVAYSIKKPLEYVDYDIKATINVLKYAGESGVRHFIFSSSSSVYGNQSEIPLREDMATGNVLSPYAAAKFGAESFCQAYQNLYHFKLSILRFFTVYGPFGRPDMAIPIFVKRLLNEQPIHTFGQNSARDYTYIDDIVGGIILCLNQKTQSEIFNLGSGQPIAMIELLKTLQKHFPRMKVIEKGYRQGDALWTWANIEKAKKELGFAPQISFKEGIRRTIEWSWQENN